jgi:hypothetical protein
MNYFYYDEDGDTYSTQLDAIASRKRCSFYYYDHQMALVDWKTSPPESLDTLYKMRAQQIRDKYKYVILCYSGGHDSTNVLETFYYNNIHIDEIVVVGAFSQDDFKGSDLNHNGEIYENVFPTLDQLHLPNTKITVVDYTKWFNDPMNFTMIKEYGNEWTKYIGGFRSVHTLFWRDLKKFIGHADANDTAYIMGADKVYVEWDRDTRPYVYFTDLSFLDYGSNYEDENFKRVNFYTDTDPITIDITRKQAHMVHEIYKINPAIMNDPNFLNKCLYNLKHPLKFISPKSRFSSLSARDAYMLSSKNSEMFSWFKEGIGTINKYGSPNVKYCLKTRPYYLE